MGSIVQLRPGHAVRRPPPKKWSPELMRAMFPEFDGEPPEPYQLSLLPRALARADKRHEMRQQSEK